VVVEPPPVVCVEAPWLVAAAVIVPSAGLFVELSELQPNASESPEAKIAARRPSFSM